MPGLQRGTSSAHIPLKRLELAPQLWEAKEITLVLNIGPLFIVTDINTPTSPKPQISGHPSPYYVWLLIQALQNIQGAAVKVALLGVDGRVHCLPGFKYWMFYFLRS